MGCHDEGVDVGRDWRPQWLKDEQADKFAVEKAFRKLLEVVKKKRLTGAQKQIVANAESVLKKRGMGY